MGGPNEHQAKTSTNEKSPADRVRAAKHAQTKAGEAKLVNPKESQAKRARKIRPQPQGTQVPSLKPPAQEGRQGEGAPAETWARRNRENSTDEARQPKTGPGQGEPGEVDQPPGKPGNWASPKARQRNRVRL
jgi:hypothetical protein